MSFNSKCSDCMADSKNDTLEVPPLNLELVYGCPPPMREITNSHSSFSSTAVAICLAVLATLQSQVWKQLGQAYKPGELAVPHSVQPGNLVLVWRHQTLTLEPRWKGPFVAFLTTPTAVKVDGIHASHLKPAPVSLEQDGWQVEKTDNPLKLHLWHQDKWLWSKSTKEN